MGPWDSYACEKLPNDVLAQGRAHNAQEEKQKSVDLRAGEFKDGRQIMFRVGFGGGPTNTIREAATEWGSSRVVLHTLDHNVRLSSDLKL